MLNELAITPTEWQVMTAHADALVKSGFLPNSVNSAAKAVAIMSLGRELGVGAWAALTSINVIQSKPTVSPQLMLALIHRSGQLEDMTVEGSDDACTVTMKRKGRTPHSYTFSDKDAELMGLLGKDNWRKQRAIMRQWRAVAGCARVVFADVILGLYTPEEMGADVIVDDQGGMTITALPQENAPPTPVGSTASVRTSSDSSTASARWTDADIKRFVSQYRKAAITDKEALDALGVSGLREFKGTLKDAQNKLDAFIEAHLPAHAAVRTSSDSGTASATEDDPLSWVDEARAQGLT